MSDLDAPIRNDAAEGTSANLEMQLRGEWASARLADDSAYWKLFEKKSTGTDVINLIVEAAYHELSSSSPYVEGSSLSAHAAVTADATVNPDVPMAYSELEGIDGETASDNGDNGDEEYEELDAEATTNASSSPYVEGGVSADVEVPAQTRTPSQTVIPKSNSANYITQRQSSRFSRKLGLTPLVVTEPTEGAVAAPKGHSGQKQSKLKHGQQSGKLEALRAKNTAKKAKVETERLVQSFREMKEDNIELDGYTVPSALSAGESVQTSLARLIAHVHKMTEDRTRVPEESLVDLFFGVRKIINSLPTMIVSSQHDNSHSVLGAEDQAYLDLVQVYDRFVSLVFPDNTVPITRAADSFPRLFQYTSYDKFVPANGISPFDCQVEMMKHFAHQLRSPSYESSSGLLTVFNPPPGTGKTTLVLGLAKQVQRSPHSRVMFKPGRRFGKNYNEARKKVGGRTFKLLYVTHKNLLPVAQQVGSLLHIDTPFGIAFSRYSKSKGKEIVEVSCNKHTCYTGKRGRYTHVPPVVLLCSPDTAVKILQKNLVEKRNKAARRTHNEYEAQTNYAMFYDEPTAAGMDQAMEGNPYIEELTKIVRYMPKHTVLSCATLKNIEAYPELIAAFRSKYPRAICNTVNHSKIPIGACIRGFDGNVYLPHSSCTTQEQLASVIEKLGAEQILQKFYTPEIVRSMFTRLSSIMGIPAEFRFSNFFATRDYTQDNFQQLAIRYLELVRDAPQHIADFCGTPYTSAAFNTENILSNAPRMSSQTLVVASDPIEQFKTAVRPHYRSILAHYQVGSFTDISTRYQSSLDAWTRAEAAELKRQEKATGSTKDGKRAKFNSEAFGNIQTRMDKWRQSNPLPSMNLPMGLRIQHIAQASLDRPKAILDYSSPDYLSIEPNSGDAEADDMLKAMLAAGVGVYSTALGSSYTNKLVELMCDGQMCFVFVNDEICYGVNYPIENIVILDTDVMLRRSVNTLLQLISRAGRKGKSDRANIWMSAPVMARLDDYIINPEFDDIETANIRAACASAMH